MNDRRVAGALAGAVGRDERVRPVELVRVAVDIGNRVEGHDDPLLPTEARFPSRWSAPVPLDRIRRRF